MNTKRITATLLIAVFLVSAIPLYVPSVRANSVINVPSDYSTIQAAINAASPGDTVLVGPGTYEPFGWIGKNNLTVKSTDGPSVTFVTGRWAVIGGSYYMTGVYVGESADARIEGFDVSCSGGNGIWVYAGSGKESPRATVKNNIVHDCCSQGITLARAPNSLIENNTVYGNSFGGGDGMGIWVSYYSHDTIVRGNEVYNTKGNGYWDSGIYVSQQGTGVIIENNDIHGNVIGIRVMVNGVLARYNNIYGNTKCGVTGMGTYSIDASLNWWGDATGPKHATTNPSGLGNEVADKVKYSPWCAIEDTDLDTLGYQLPTPMVWGVSTNGTIQEAVNQASPGDTVLVAAGTYIQTGDLVIDKEVYILGASGKPTIQFDGGSDNVVIKADNVLLEHLSFIKTADSLWNSYILEVPKGGHPDYLSLYGGLTIRDCSFEGGKDGAMYINMNGDFTLENSEFIGYAAYSTVQIAAFDGEVTISGNTFTGSSGGRVIVVEPGPVEQILYGGTMNIIENTVTGVKSFLVFNHWAEPSKKVDINIEENVLDDITGDAISIWTCGNIDIGKLGPVQINRNTFKNIAGAAIRVDTTEAASYGIPTNPFGVLNLTAKQNNIYGKYGIINEYTSTIDARYNYWGDPSGPFHATANPGGLGAAVSDNVTFYPWLFDSYPPPPPTWPPEPYVPPVSQTEVRGNADTILSTLGDVIIAGEDASVAGEELDYNHDGMVNIADAWDQLVDAGLLRPPSFTFDPEAASAFLRMLQSIYGETLENFPSLEGRVWLLYMLAYLPYQ